MRIRNTIHPEACPFLGKRSCQVLRTGILVQYQLRCQIVDSWNAYKLDNCWPPGPNIIITSFSPESKLNLAWNINNGCLACGHRHLIHFSPFRILIPISHRDKGGSRAQVSSTGVWYPKISIFTLISRSSARSSYKRAACQTRPYEWTCSKWKYTIVRTALLLGLQLKSSLIHWESFNFV